MTLPKFKLNGFPFSQKDQAPTTYPSHETIKKTALLLAEGKTVAWYQGNGELGPRALGNRSLLMNPLINNGKIKINNIKRRENIVHLELRYLMSLKKNIFILIMKILICFLLLS